MNEAKTTWALVVGIDRYDLQAIRELKGAVRDALATTQWLLKLGVPANQILLHAVPSKATEPELAVLPPLGLKALPAHEPDIVASIAKLATANNGKGGARLFVFLAGHGYYEPGGGRMFLLQEAGMGGVWTNMGMEYYMKWLRSLPFRRQFLFVDGCQNYPYKTTERPTMAAGRPGGAPDRVPLAPNALVACFAAGQEQRALEVEGRGAFTKTLLDLLDLDALGRLPAGDPRYGVIHHDWQKGTRSLDLRKLIGDFVRDRVRDVTAAHGLEQRVDLQPAGAAEGEAQHLMIQFAQMPTVRVGVDVLPRAANPYVVSLRVTAPDLLFSCELNRGGAAPLPTQLLLPRGTDGEAYCYMQVSAPWDETRLRQQFRTDTDTTVGFQVRPRATGAISRSALGEPIERAEVFSVKTLTTDGLPVGAMEDHGGYVKVAQALGRDLPQQGDDLGAGITIDIHEDGPEFRVPADKLGEASVLAHEWAKAMRSVLPADVVVATHLRGDATPGDETRVILQLPAGGAGALAGALVNVPAVLVQPVAAEDVGLPIWRNSKAVSLRSLEARPVLNVSPGPQRVRLELPWGGWTRLINAEPGGQAVVTLPARIGHPPLRVVLWPDLVRSQNALVILAQSQPAVAIREQVRADPTPLRALPHSGHASAWVVQLPELRGRPTAIVGDGQARMEFPLPRNRSFGVALNPSFQVEPLSLIPAPEWDLLVSKGDLDELTPEDGIRLTKQKWDDVLLGVAGAYALFSRSAWGDLMFVIMNLSGLGPQPVDTDLLAIAARRAGNDHPLSPPDIAALRARSGEIPVFRWGPRLARSLIERVAMPGEDLLRWWAELDRIERSMSPNSVWTAWAAVD